MDEQEILKRLIENRKGRIRRPGKSESVKKPKGGFVLSDEQEYALKQLKNFAKTPYSEDTATACLTGYAGTGKTSIMKMFVEFLEREDIDYRLCAPTHKAKYVLSKSTKRKASTIHGLLKMTPNVEVQDLDYKDLEFVKSDEAKLDIPYKGIIIIDECSMVNTPLYEAFLELSKIYKVKIMYQGDPAQIRPVNEGAQSPTFERPNLSLKLTKVFRQSDESALVPILMSLRREPKYSFTTALSGKGSIIVEDTVKGFIKPFIDIIRNAMLNMDTDAAKVICYRNVMVRQFNEFVRKCILKEDVSKKPFIRGEFLMGYENFEYDKMRFYNSSDYIINEEPKRCPIVIPGVGVTEGWMLSVYDKVDEKSACVPMLDVSNTDESIIRSWILNMESVRLEALEAYGQNRKNLWAQYFHMRDCCAINAPLVYQKRVIKNKTFDYGYAITSHRSQGSSYTSVFIDMDDLLLDRDEAELRQLQYVAMSRTRTDVHLLMRSSK